MCQSIKRSRSIKKSFPRAGKFVVCKDIAPPKRDALAGLLLFISFILGACTVGNGRICGPQTPSAYCEEVAYQKLFHPKPYLHLWVKEGVIQPQDRRDDSAKCGGQPSDSNPMRVHNEESLQLSGETLWETRQRLAYQWQRCMLNKGYRFTGACYDNEISRDSPACMGRELISLP